MTPRTYKIAILAGDGIGKEVVPAGLAAIEAAIKGTGIAIDWTELPWGCDYYLEKGRMMDEDGFEQAAKFDEMQNRMMRGPGRGPGAPEGQGMRKRQGPGELK